jgi:hypothetical protein
MNAQTQYRATAAAALVLTLTLAGCGGGGGGTDSTAPSATASSQFGITASTPQALAFPTAEALTQQAYARIRDIQKAEGLNFIPVVPQDINPALNLATKNHLNYMFTNKAFTASEDMSLPGSTGPTAGKQAAAAGYQGGIDGGEYAPLPPSVTGDQWIDAILSTGTGARLLLPNGEYGFAFAPWPNASTPTAMGGMAMAGWYPNTLAGATNSKTELYLYPYNGQTNVPPTNLVPDYPGSFNNFFAGDTAGSHGTPITFIVGGNYFVQFQSAVLKDSQGNVIPTTTYGATTDPHTGAPNGATAPGWEAYAGLVMPTAPLQPNTTYTLTYDVFYGPSQVAPGQIRVVPEVRGTLTFTTGSQQPFNPNKLF